MKEKRIVILQVLHKKKIYCLVGIILLTVLLFPMFRSGVSINTEGILSLDTRIALAVNIGGEFGNGEPLPQQIESTFSRGGVPVISISYVDGIHIDMSDPFIDIDFTRKQIEQWTKNKTIAEAEAIITEEAQKYFEIQIKLSDIEGIDANDPLMQDSPILLDNERIEKLQGKDWLIITIAYFGIHLYNLDFYEGDFITRINSLDAGPIIGEWWQ